ncbi:salivary glue protein Sgs-3-like isoform X2 [Clupea harengus]|uniref:Salivary glue protein Sgs-3-like isoform X2 n=1 Tax=Clupea harengus TaxID=7950 RepID=A0A8M1KA03_CLUHA|nr:salivary glue protein Sgs-3-like isoform X2 [Clupea harengus]
MMICASCVALLLLVILQTPQESTASCSSPTSLCCLGTNSTCFRNSCYCDEYCITARDCCSDYNQTCRSPLSPTNTPPGTSALTPEDAISTTPPLTSSQLPTSSTYHETPEEPSAVMEKPKEITTPPGTSALTPEDAISTTPPLTSSQLPTSNTDHETPEEPSPVTEKPKDPTRVIMRVRGFLHTNTGEEAVLEALRKLVSLLENKLKDHCTDCTVQILKHNMTTNDP